VSLRKWKPLATGFLNGEYRNTITAIDWTKIRREHLKRQRHRWKENMNVFICVRWLWSAEFCEDEIISFF